MSQPSSPRPRPRARELGIVIGTGTPGRHNAITDVPGVMVGHCTVDDGAEVRTGVTVVRPHDGLLAGEPVFAGYHALNGNGELTGAHWIAESGLLSSPVAITNTHAVGVVRDALVDYELARAGDDPCWSLPVVGETYDGYLNDINGHHVRGEHLAAAMDSAASGPVAEGNVGGGTGMLCHRFKGGIGTSSRVTPADAGGWTVGALVQANYGYRERLTVDGVPVGREIGGDEIPEAGFPFAVTSSSIIIVLATDAPLLPVQCRRLAQRATVGLARVGGAGENSSGDIFLAFSTANRVPQAIARTPEPFTVRTLPGPAMDLLFHAAADAVEESIVNALTAARTMTGAGGRTAHELPLDRLVEVMRKYGRLQD